MLNGVLIEPSANKNQTLIIRAVTTVHIEYNCDDSVINSSGLVSASDKYSSKASPP